MTTCPTHQRPELVSQATLDDLFTDAQNWRDLTAELTARGHERMTTVAAIAGVFPDFRQMADALHAETDPKVAPALQDPPDPFLDVFLTPSSAEPNQKSHGSILGLPEMEVQTIAYLESVFGPVIAGYTADAQLAFAFEDLREVHTVPLRFLLDNLVRQLTTKQAFRSKKTKPNRSSVPAKNTRLM
jgi:hypothetical protein